MAHRRSSSPSTRRPSRRYTRCSRSTPTDDSARRRSSTTSRPRSTSRVSRQTRRRTIARRPTTSCGSSRQRRRHDPAGRRVRRRRRVDPAAGLDGRGERARSIPQQLSRARIAARGDQADRLRLPAERPAVAAPPANTTASPPSPRIRICAARRCWSRANSTSSPRPRTAALAAYTRYVNEFPRPVETAVETRFKIAGLYQAAHDEALYGKELEQIVRVDAEAGAERTGRDADAGGALGAGAVRTALRGVRGRGAASAVRDEPAGETSSSWTPHRAVRTARRL